MSLTREDLLSGRSLKHETVEVPALGGSVNVYEMAPRQRMDFAMWAKSLAPAGVAMADFDPTTLEVEAISDYREQVLVRSLRDDVGKLLFEPADVAALGDMLDDDTLTLLCGMAVDLSGLTQASIEKKADDLPNSPDASAS
jgi:hypothetical protein